MSTIIQADKLVEETTTVVSLPEIYLRVKQVIDDPDSGLSDIACILSRDPGLTARLLKIANSAFIGLSSKVDNPMLAVNLLGPQMVHDLVLATSVTRAFAGVCDSIIKMDIFWQNSIYCGAICRLLAEESTVASSERYFIVGLLSDIGHLVMYHQLAGPCQAALQRSQEENMPLHRIESEMIGCNYAEVGGKLLACWGLPEQLHQPVRYQADPGSAEGYVKDAAIAGIAAGIVHSAGADVPLAERELDFDDNGWQMSGLDKDGCQQVLATADKAANEVLASIFPGLSEVA